MPLAIRWEVWGAENVALQPLVLVQ
jgi:hypothetical protein